MMLDSRKDPLLADAVEVRKLSGHSGAQVFLITKDGRHWFVRKAASEPANSERLKGQAQKQAAFVRDMHEVVSTPRILDQGENRRPFLLRHGIRTRTRRHQLPEPGVVR